MKGKTYITNCNIITDEKILKSRVVEIVDGKICGVYENAPGDMQNAYDAKGNFLSAGFVDIHTHGGYGSDFMDATDEGFDNVLKFHLDNGTTSVLATSVTAPKTQIVDFLEAARAYKGKGGKYAKLLGCHLEGPYLSLKNKGAQKEKCLLSPDKDDYRFMKEYADVVKTVTIAPELPKADEMTAALRKWGIIVCGGHDDGIYPEFMPAIENGLTHLTHIYCAMSDVRFKDGKRNVGLREYGLTDDRLTVEMIADNRHIPPELAKMIIRAKGVDKVCVVSDSLRCAGMPLDGKLYRLGLQTDTTAQRFKVADGVAVMEDGSHYAGSVTPVRQMVKNLVAAGISLCDAVKMGTSVPAKIIGRTDIGSVEVGKSADLCVLDKELNLVDVFVDGERKEINNGKDNQRN